MDVQADANLLVELDEGRLTGDCIDCFACVRVCPTGIDIRNGTQLECVNCTACIDACDAIMISINRKTGLIRFASENNINAGEKVKFSKRIKAYSAVLLLLICFLAFLLITRTDVDAVLMRTAGMTYTSLPDGRISNLYNLKLINKTHNDIPLTIKIEDGKGEIQIINPNNSIVKKEDYSTIQFFIILNRNDLKNWKTEIELGLYDKKGKIKSVEASFIGPEIYD